MTLSMANNGKVRIVAIQGGRQFRVRLSSLGIDVGMIVEIKRKGVAGGPILINVNGRDVALGRGMADKIIVEEMG